MRIVLSIFGLVFLLAAQQCTLEKHITEVSSPNADISVNFFLASGNQAAYSVRYRDRLLVDTSRLGFEFRDAAPLGKDLSIIDTRTNRHDETWETVWGTHLKHRNHYNELEVVLRENFNDSRIFSVFFRVFDDGLALRYVIPEQAEIGDSVIVTNELTEVMFAEDHDAWWIPADYDSYEYVYSASKVSEIDASKYYINNDRVDRQVNNLRAVNTPVTLLTADSTYLSLHEAELIDYAGITLATHGNHGFMTELVPWADGKTKVKAKLPLKTPWRTLQIAETPDALIHSPMIMNLNEPNKIENTDWIEPMVYSGIWWELHIGKSAWGINVMEGSWSGAGRKVHGATTENAKAYIEFNAENDIRGLLIEGWNTGWEYWGLDTAEFFDFVTTYPDFDLEEVSDYAKKNGVALIGHHETAGDAQNYDKRMEDAFSLYQRYGIKAVKTGYAGGIIPKGEHHHGQWMVRHYRRVIETAAKYNIMINAHEPIADTGERRTWPNMMSREGVRGTEYEAWSEGNPPDHTTIVPFTRMLSGPLDYTAGIFDVEFNQYREKNRVHTTLAKQLALMVILYSPMQMAADLPENYRDNPGFQFIRHLVADWSESIVLNGMIGEYITIARKDRNSPNWYLAGITNEEDRTVEVALDFLEDGKDYRAEIYADGAVANWEKAPLKIRISEQMVTNADSLSLQMASGGGVAIFLQQVRE